jgi:RNA polymerase sigma-70 factor (ECF subfamily)
MATLTLISRVRSLFRYDENLTALQARCADGDPPACNELDAQLILQANNGQRHAMDELLNRHYVGLYRFVRRLTRNDQDAEDMVHSVFITTTLERLDQLAERIRESTDSAQAFQYRAYLIRSARNRFLDEKKLAWHAWRFLVDDDQALVRLCDKQQTQNDSRDPPDHLATKKLLRALFRLPPEQEEALTLKVSGYSMEEIADIQGVPMETAKDRRRTAVRKLKAWLAELKS